MKAAPRWVSAAFGMCLATALGAGSGTAESIKAFRHPVLDIPGSILPVEQLPPEIAEAIAEDLAALGASPEAALYDPRTGRVSSLVLSEPLIPGSGRGNGRTWPGETPSGVGLEAEAWRGLRSYLERHCARLRVDVAELDPPRVTVADGGALIHLYVPRRVGGLRVRDSALSATIRHGNLVLFSLQNWGDVPELAAVATPEAARAAVRRHDATLSGEALEAAPRLELVPADGGDRIEYRPVWVFGAAAAGWEALVDAERGELLAFDAATSSFASAPGRIAAPEGAAAHAPEPRGFALFSPAGAASFREVYGGVYPVSNDQVGADGTEQPGYPMPFADVTAGPLELFCDAGGNAGCHDGTITTSLSGPFVRIVDNCGPIAEGSVGDIDLGIGPLPADTNCTVPSGHSAGDTKASRTTYYALNQFTAQARGYLPAVAWLQEPITANVNQNMQCNAFWNGATLNLFRAGSGCANTGEIASILDHIWVNAFDNNVGNTVISRPADGISDVLASLFLNQSCVGRGLQPGVNCDGFGDACLSCTGVRDVDYEMSASNLPHGLAFAAACPITGGGSGPCGRARQCEAQILGEVGWDLAHRDLVTLGLSPSTALELASRLFFLASPAVTDWYQCVAGIAGCPTTAGYLNVLAADDDDGVLTNGTPHMSAIYAAFNRHGIACSTPTIQDFGCAGGPTAPPALTVTARDKGAALSWNNVVGASSYVVYRTEGVNACGTGKIRIAQVDGQSFEDTGLQNGRSYSYSVQAIGTTQSCTGPMSACQSVVPTSGVNLAFRGLGSVTPAGGDGDPFLDNCERGRLSVEVENTGGQTLTNVRIVGFSSPSHPGSLFPTVLPVTVASTLPPCASEVATISFYPRSMSFGQTLLLEIEVTADELFPHLRTLALEVRNVESDLAPVASRTYQFESDGDLEGWSIVQGIWTQATAAGGAGGTTRYVRSSQALDNACDQIRSPLVRLTPSSTLTLSTNFAIEPFDGFSWYDRANASVFDAEAGSATTISPSSGRVYNIGPGTIGGSCVTANEAGWGGTQNTWASSVWNSAALNPGGAFTARLAQVEIAYATDVVVALDGLRFDEVTLTNFEEVTGDPQLDLCSLESVSPSALSVDGSGNGVLQPGEVAEIRPTWENAGAGPVVLTGGLSGFTGPMPATYAIVDGAADYGTLAFDESSECVDCYQMQVTAPARPVTHWDATVLETVAPTGQSKSWTLHIGDSFSDVAPANIFYRFVETILHNQVTAGCGPALYCPGDPTTREQMAVFVLVAKDGIGVLPPACGAPIFGDVPASSPYCRFIEELARRGVVAGCGGGNYCPTAPVSREQMAVFALATEEGSGYAPPACGTPLFGDVPAASPFCRWIEELARRGVVAGCGGGNYCPTSPVTREQMSVFLTQTFGLRLYGP